MTDKIEKKESSELCISHRCIQKVVWFLQDGDTYTRRIGGKNLNPFRREKIRIAQTNNSWWNIVPPRTIHVTLKNLLKRTYNIKKEKIWKKYKILFLLMILLCISCGNNKISIKVGSALISSPDNQILRSLTLENDSLLFAYQILLKDGCLGLSSINLNRVNDAYVITYGNSVIENKKFHLQPDAIYYI